MLSTSTNECHYIVWTPVGTKVFLVQMDNGYVELLINYLYKFWAVARDGTEPVWHEDIFGLKQKSKEIAANSTCIYATSTSYISTSLTSNDDLQHFSQTEKQVANAKLTTCIVRKCQGCKDPEWKCKLNPCEVRQKRKTNSILSSTNSFQSYKYGSNGLHNSCHQDTFLEVLYHTFKLQFNCLSGVHDLGLGLKALLEAFTLRERQSFHESKMALWSWLRNNTTNGHTYYAYGKEAFS